MLNNASKSLHGQQLHLFIVHAHQRVGVSGESSLTSGPHQLQERLGVVDLEWQKAPHESFVQISGLSEFEPVASTDPFNKKIISFVISTNLVGFVKRKKLE